MRALAPFVLSLHASVIRKLVRQVAAGVAALLAASAAHANYFCTGPIDNVDVSPSGLGVVQSGTAGLQSVYLCTIGTTANGVGPDACNAILSVVIAAHATQASVTWAFDDSLTCTTHPAWSWLTGWYYGPQIS